MVSSIGAGWIIKHYLDLLGIVINVFSAHSTRSTRTSKAEGSGLSVPEILERGSWLLESTWQKFYKKQKLCNKRAP